MKIVNIKNNILYLKEYLTLCHLEWGKNNHSIIDERINKVANNDKIISILGLIDNNILVGFISLFKYDGRERIDLTPWYATMYVKKEFRGNGYSKILNSAIIKEAKKLGYSKLYLKTNLINYYEKFGAKYVESLNNNESLYYIDI